MFRKKSILIGGVILLVMGVVAVGEVGSGGRSSRDTIQAYSSFNSLYRGVEFGFSIPEALAQENDLKFESVASKMVHISNDNYIFKAAPFVHEGADIGGKYEEYEFDETYNVKGDTSIEMLRVRFNTGENVLLNWYSSGVSYYLDVVNAIKFEDAIGLLGLDYGYLNKTKEIKGSKVSDTKEDFIEIFNARIKTPKNLSLLLIEDKDSGVAIFLLDGNIVMSIGDKNDIEDSATGIMLKDRYYLWYTNKNPFEETSESFNLYDELIDSMDNIIESFEVL